MWFALGFVTLAVSMGYQWWSRWHRGWRGSEDLLAGIRCETKLRSFKGMVYGITVGIDAPETFRFELKRERAWDRFFKWTGLTVEHQFGHEGFDPLVYVASNDQHLLSTFEGDKALLHIVQHIFAPRTDLNWVKQVRCANGRIWMEIGTSELAGAPSLKAIREAAANLLPLLQAVSRALDASMPDASPASRDRHLIPSVILLALSSGMAINGFFSWTRSLVASPEFMLETQGLWGLTWTIAAFVLAILTLATLYFLKGSARVHLVLLEMALVGTFGAVSSAAIELRDANIELDTSQVAVIERNMVGKSIGERRRHFQTTRTYYFQVRDWVNSGELRSVSVSASTYEKAAVGDTLHFEQHAGYFGWRWAEYKGWQPRAVIAPPT